MTFPSGVLGATQFQAINITIAGDTIPEGTGNGRSPQGETFTVTLSGPELVKPIGTGTIFDNDPPFTPPSGRSTGIAGVNQQLISRTPSGGLPNAAGDVGWRIDRRLRSPLGRTRTSTPSATTSARHLRRASARTIHSSTAWT